MVAVRVFASSFSISPICQSGSWLLSLNLLIVFFLHWGGSVDCCMVLGAVFCEAGKGWGKSAVNRKKRYLQPITACLAVRLHRTVLGCCCESCWGGSIFPLGTVKADVVLEHPAESFCLQAPRPSTGPHKLRECLPLIIFLRNRLKYALTGDEVKKICMQRFIKIDGKVRTDITYPAGFMGEHRGLGQVPRAALLH